MNEPISILHISDLHRSCNSHISNSALLSSLLNDIERYGSEIPMIIEPNVIVVSGDVIRGSTSQDNSDDEINAQYAEAQNFLNDLVEKILGGDKSRIVLVPGNHDIDWNVSRCSMERISDDQVLDKNGRLKSGVFEDAVNTHSDIKWCWSDLSFYRIKNMEVYEERLRYFVDFYSDFYEGEKTYSIRPYEQYDIFDIPDLGITIVGFNSCYNNDHLNRAGAIHPDCIANSNIALKKNKTKGRLLLAAWHHNTNGMPYANDYMDNSFLKNLIDSDVKFGFHGHQHKTEVIHEANNVFEQKKITVFSSGTLCGGPKDLPTGYNRQFNVITISNNAKDKSVLNVVLHSREKTAASSFDNPVWGKGNIDSSVNSYITLTFLHEVTTLNTDNELSKAELLVSDKKYGAAIKELEKLDKNDPIVRTFLLKCYFELDDFNSILDEFYDPINIEEAVHALNASLSSTDQKKIRKLLSSSLIRLSDDPSIIHIKKKIEASLK